MALVGTVNSPNDYGFKNRIINGGMNIWQRGTSGFTTNNTYVFTSDRNFVFTGTSLAGTHQQVSTGGLVGFPYALRVQRNSGSTGTSALGMGQVIESINTADLAGQTVTVSYYARAGANYSTAGNVLYQYLNVGTGTDQGTANWINSAWTGQVNIYCGSSTLTTSWQRFSFTYTVPSGTNEIGIWMTASPTGTAGSNDYFDITGIQLEKGSIATPFDFRPYSVELQLCQRYYETAAVGFSAGSTGFGGNSYFNEVSYKVQKRINPTVSIRDWSGNAGKMTIWKAATQYDNVSVNFEINDTFGFQPVTTGSQTDAGLGRLVFYSNAELT